MIRRLLALVAQLDSAYAHASPFGRLKARLLAGFTLLVALWIPFNIAKLGWVQPPYLPLRLLINGWILTLSLTALVLVWRGRLALAANGFAIGLILPTHLLALLGPSPVEPVALAVQMLVFDLVFLMFALVFATRSVAVVVAVVALSTSTMMYVNALAQTPLPGSLRFAADTLFRDGVFAILFMFCLGITISRMIESAHRRSEEALRATRSSNENLEALVLERTRALEIATRQAQDSSRAKGEFLANMSHEIRTPLNGVIASAELLRQHRGLPPAAAEQIRIIAESGDLLLKLLSDILDLSKIDAGQLAVEAHPFDLPAVLNDTLALLGDRASSSGVRLLGRIDPALPRHVLADSYRLRQVLLNLVANAIKFTPPGGEVCLAATRRGGAPGAPLVRFEVTDTGIGMDQATLSRIFHRFTQADSSTTRRFGGTGLGLAISTHLVRLMGGHLHATSVVGRGSTFFFELSLASASAPAPVKTLPAPPEALHADVLVVEDNAINQRVLAAQLTQLNCRFTLASDGEEALALLSEGAVPDVILMDCHMPRLDGWTTTQHVRAWAAEDDPRRRRVARVPIIALTAAALPEERRRCLDAGMDAFLSKPARLAELAEAIRQARARPCPEPADSIG